MPLVLEDELLEAVRSDEVALVAYLLESGADPNAGLFRDETAISIAVQNGNEDILKLLLQHGSLCCMNEKRDGTQDPEYQAPVARFGLVQLIKNFAKTLCLTCIGTYAVQSLSKFLPSPALQRFGLYASRYVWYTGCYAVLSYHTREGSFQSRYTHPFTYFDTFFSMSFPHRTYVFLVGKILPPPPILPPPTPTYLQDLAVAFPLRLGIDILVTTILKLGARAGFFTNQQQSPRWIGALPPFPPPQLWRSPAERVFYAVLSSESVTETMALELLTSGALVCQPYETSELARKLLELAITNCWPELTSFLISNGVPIDQGASTPSRSEKWPPLFDALIYAFPAIKQEIQHFDKQYFEGNSVLSSLDETRLFYMDKYSTFAILTRSRKFRRLAESDSEDDWALCKRMMDLLRDSGVDPLLADSSSCDALEHLVKGPCSKEVLEHMAHVWQDASRNPDHEKTPDVKSRALHEVVNTLFPNLDAIRILIDSGVSPEWEDRSGNTPLYTAGYMNNKTDALELLFQYGADPNNGGATAYPPILRTLDDASYEKFFCFLEHGADPNGKEKNGDSILQAVLKLEPSLAVLKARLVGCLLDRGAVVWDPETRSSPAFLTAALQHNSTGWNEKILDMLIDQIPPEQRYKQLNDALLAASFNQKHTLWAACDLFTVFYLIRNGADPRIAKNESSSLLHSICSVYSVKDHDYREEMKSLLHRRVLDVNSRDIDGNSPLHLAITQDSRDFALLLLEYGAHPNALDAKGRTPLQILCTKKLEGYNISHAPEEIEDDKDDSQYRGVRGQASWLFVSRKRMLQIKASLNQEEMFQALVEHGADVNIVDSQGRTLLMAACELGNSAIVANILYKISGAGCLEDVINAADHLRKTAIHIAAINGDINTLKMLLCPEQILIPQHNPWRMLAVRGEDLLENKSHGDPEFEKQREMAQQVHRFEETRDLMGPLKRSYVRMSAPKDTPLSIGSPQRAMQENICLPNVSASTWNIGRREGSVLRPGKLVDVWFRTPLHYAAEGGNLEAVKLLLNCAGISPKIEDSNGKRAADLALDNSFYDIYSTLEEFRP